MWGTDLTSVIDRRGPSGGRSSPSIIARPSASASTPAAAPIASRRSSPSVRACASASAPSARTWPAVSALRHDHGSQYVSHHFQAEIRFLGIESSPAFVREPEGNGCAERFIRTLKENLLWVRHFATVEELRLALSAFRQTYNQSWIIERHGYKTPAQVRADQIGPMPMAA